jgi:purine-binding chemotaxis protein CheW
MSSLTRAHADATHDHSAVDPDERDRILNERARALARRPVELAQTLLRRDAVELLQFRLASERYAIEAQYVHRVIRPRELTRLPGAPPLFRGVANLRGEILPVFDLREWLDVERVAPNDDTRWLVLGVHAPEICLWVDGVTDIVLVDPGSFHRSERADRRAQELVQGVTQNALSVLDAARLLAHPDLFIGEAGNGRKEISS